MQKLCYIITQNVNLSANGRDSQGGLVDHKRNWHVVGVNSFMLSKFISENAAACTFRYCALMYN